MRVDLLLIFGVASAPNYGVCIMSVKCTSNLGFTLIEAMIAISVMVILIFTGVPSFIQFIRDSSAVTQSNSMVSAINLARTEAVRRGSVVRLTASSDSNGVLSWNNGWIVWVDSNEDYIASEDEVVKYFPAVTAGANFSSQSNEVVFNSQGELDGVNLYTITFTPEGCRDNEQRVITISNTGRPSTNRADCPL